MYGPTLRVLQTCTRLFPTAFFSRFFFFSKMGNLFSGSPPRLNKPYRVAVRVPAPTARAAGAPRPRVPSLHPHTILQNNRSAQKQPKLGHTLSPTRYVESEPGPNTPRRRTCGARRPPSQAGAERRTARARSCNQSAPLGCLGQVQVIMHNWSLTQASASRALRLSSLSSSRRTEDAHRPLDTRTSQPLLRRMACHDLVVRHRATPREPLPRLLALLGLLLPAQQPAEERAARLGDVTLRLRRLA